MRKLQQEHVSNAILKKNKKKQANDDLPTYSIFFFTRYRNDRNVFLGFIVQDYGVFYNNDVRPIMFLLGLTFYPHVEHTCMTALFH